MSKKKIRETVSEQSVAGLFREMADASEKMSRIDGDFFAGEASAFRRCAIYLELLKNDGPMDADAALMHLIDLVLFDDNEDQSAQVTMSQLYKLLIDAPASADLKELAEISAPIWLGKRYEGLRQRYGRVSRKKAQGVRYWVVNRKLEETD